MEYLINGGAGEPGTGMSAKTVAEALEAAIHGETHEYSDMYPGMAKEARDEGFDEIADWFETLAKAERSHANKFTKTLAAHKAEQ
jgi:rubrerythrin